MVLENVMRCITDEESIKLYYEELSGVLKLIDDTMRQQCLRITAELCLYRDSPMSPLISRERLTPEFFNHEGELYDSFFKQGDSRDVPLLFAQNKTVMKSIGADFSAKYFKNMLKASLSDGFFTIYSINVGEAERSPAVAEDCYRLLAKGIYRNVWILSSEEDFHAKVPEQVITMMRLASEAVSIKVSCRTLSD